MKKKQALTIVKNNRIQNSKNYRKSGKGSYGASEKKWKLCKKNQSNHWRLLTSFKNRKLWIFLKKLYYFIRDFCVVSKISKKWKKKSKFKKLPKQYTKSVFLSFFFLLYNKTILKIKKNITKTLNFHRNQCQKKSR